MKLLAMSGLIPEQICDVVRFTQYAGERNLPHYCGYASDFISQVMQDNRIDGAVAISRKQGNSSIQCRFPREGTGRQGIILRP